MAEAAVPRAASHRPAPVAVLRAATVVALWAIWEAASRSGLFYAGVLPSSFRILRDAGALLLDPSFYINLGFTAAEVAAAVAIGAGLGLSVGLALGANRFLGRAFEPYIAYIAPAPKIVFLPIFLVLFGIGAGSKIAVGALSCFFPMALSVAAGVRQIDPVLLRVGRSFNLSRGQTIRKIYLPALAPPIVTGLRLGMGVAVIGTLLAEIKMSNHGLGFVIMQDYGRFAIAEMYAVLVIIFGLSAAANALIGRLLHRQRRGS